MTITETIFEMNRPILGQEHLSVTDTYNVLTCTTHI